MPPSLGRALAVIAARPVPPIHGPAAAATTRICVTSAAPGPGPGQPVGAPPTSAEALPWRSRNAHSWPPPPPPPPASSPLRPAATAARQCLVVTSGRLAQPRCHADAGAAGHGGTVANLPDRQRCAAVSHAPAQQRNRDGGSGTEEHPGRTGRHVAADIEQLLQRVRHARTDCGSRADGVATPHTIPPRGSPWLPRPDRSSLAEQGERRGHRTLTYPSAAIGPEPR
jgi:hypothetical protein